MNANSSVVAAASHFSRLMPPQWNAGTPAASSTSRKYAPKPSAYTEHATAWANQDIQPERKPFGSGSDDAVEEEDEQQGRPSHTGGNAGQHENPGADHRADADHRDVQQPHLATEADLRGDGALRAESSAPRCRGGGRPARPAAPRAGGPIRR